MTVFFCVLWSRRFCAAAREFTVVSETTGTWSNQGMGAYLLVYNTLITMLTMFSVTIERIINRRKQKNLNGAAVMCL